MLISFPYFFGAVPLGLSSSYFPVTGGNYSGGSTSEITRMILILAAVDALVPNTIRPSADTWLSRSLWQSR